MLYECTEHGRSANSWQYYACRRHLHRSGADTNLDYQLDGSTGKKPLCGPKLRVFRPQLGDTPSLGYRCRLPLSRDEFRGTRLIVVRVYVVPKLPAPRRVGPDGGGCPTATTTRRVVAGKLIGRFLVIYGQTRAKPPVDLDKTKYRAGYNTRGGGWPTRST